MELTAVHHNKNLKPLNNHIQPQENIEPLEPQRISKKTPFIESNTQAVSFEHLKNDCIIPSFAKDLESTIAHFEFIETVCSVAQSVYSDTEILVPEIRVSHQIKGRIPSAIGKPVKELKDHEKTQYWERMAFVVEVPSITTYINGQELKLTIGGVRSYSEQNLYSKKSIEKFKVFIGFKNMVCTNLCVNTDGLMDDLRVSSIDQLRNGALELIQNYSQQEHIEQMQQFLEYNMSENQFAHLIGKMKLYHCIDKSKKTGLFNLKLMDSQISNVVKDYVEDDNFKCEIDGSINLWNLYNLFTNSAKSNYIDNFLNRNCNSHEFTNHIKNKLKSQSEDFYVFI
ncbi:DUF3871 family protein [Winogradskyella poriferorum]|uniref:DUF3871 family protein n=1 Tax=Winogradskyella poriferorum TaxID=307627 RepID=A0ABU7W1K7_9FLAO